VTRRSHRWTPARMADLEAAVTGRRRVALSRRGTEYVVIAQSLRVHGREEVLIARLPMTGEDLEFVLDEIETFDVLGV